MAKARPVASRDARPVASREARPVASREAHTRPVASALALVPPYGVRAVVPLYDVRAVVPLDDMPRSIVPLDHARFVVPFDDARSVALCKSLPVPPNAMHFQPRPVAATLEVHELRLVALAHVLQGARVVLLEPLVASGSPAQLSRPRNGGGRRLGGGGIAVRFAPVQATASATVALLHQPIASRTPMQLARPRRRGGRRLGGGGFGFGGGRRGEGEVQQ